MNEVKFLLAILFSLFMVGCNAVGDEQSNQFDKPHDPNRDVIVADVGPKKGGLGTKVVVTGENFGNEKEKVRLFFNEREALVIKVQDNAIYALVPRQPGEFSTVKVMVDDKEFILEDTYFQYYIKAVVTTVAGRWNVIGNPPVDGPALDATFYRPAKISVDDVGNVLVADDQTGARMRLISTTENRMTTVLNMNTPWSTTFNEQFTHNYVMERWRAQRPILFYSLSKESNYIDSELYYDQQDEQGNWIFGSFDACAIGADDTWIYMMSESGERFVRVHQETRKVELIGQNIPTGRYSHMTFNAVDRMMYLSLEASGRIMRFDPQHTPPGRTTPWITWDDMEWIVGTGVVSSTSREGHGREAQLGTLCGLGSDHEGNVYICDQKFHCVWKIDPLLNCTVFAGPPAGPAVEGYRDGKPEEALFNRPYDITATYDGLIYVADTFNRVVRCISIQ